MEPSVTHTIRWPLRVAAWLVHLLTASGAVIALFTLSAIHQGRFVRALWLMAAAVLVDGVDGFLARRARVTVAAPQVDGALLDNLLDYVTYALVPSFFLLAGNLLPSGAWGGVGASLILLASAYQFSQPDAKTSDHFFKGFPDYWNVVVFYFFVLGTPTGVNLLVLVVLVILTFVPIKYVYPTRLEFLSPHRWVRRGMLAATVAWALATVALLWIYPETNAVLAVISLGYVALYGAVSLYRTFVPIGS